MSLEPDLVIEGFAQLLGKPIEDSGAERLSKLLMSNEEFLAYIVLVEKAYRHDAAICASLCDAAFRSHVGTNTVRTETSDLAPKVAARRRVREALATLIEANHANCGTGTSANEAIGRLARTEGVTATHPGFRWRIGSPL